MHRRFVTLAALLSLPLLGLTGCESCGTDPQNGGNGGGGSGGSGGAGGAGGGGAGGLFQGGAGSGGCSTSAECGGGVCVNGACCAAASACKTACCAAGDICLFDACVTPGKPCHTANDCDPGQYCETALGEGGGGGAGGGMGGGCVAPLPLEGKCVDLPPVCDPQGLPPGCVPACEYHPPAGQLNAIVEWEWTDTNAVTKPQFADVWSTPTVGRVYDGNCDGKVDVLDAPNVVFVSGRAVNVNTGLGTCCHCTGAANSACLTGVLRMLDGRTGQEIWSLDAAEAGSIGFAGFSVAIGDLDGDQRMDVAAVTGEGYVVVLDAAGTLLMKSDQPIPGHGDATFGWGGGLAIADVDGDGAPEIAYGATLFSTAGGALTRLWSGAGGLGGGGVWQALSTFADLDGAPDGHLELLAGRSAYKADGTFLWDRNDLPDGFPAVGNFDLDPEPEVVLAASGQVWVLDALTGATEMGPLTLPGTGAGGPPTIADFDGDGAAEIGVAKATYYVVVKPDAATDTLSVLWQTPNHDLSSSVTGSSVFDFEGDGKAEVVYGDECFLWVFDGQTGAVRFAAPHSHFTATEASLVADVDGDGHAEILMVSSGADPSSAGWGCEDANGNPVTVNGATWTPGPFVNGGYRGIKVFGDQASSWVGTRTLWNQHTYHVTNVCDDRDSACPPPNVYGTIPVAENDNWTLPWLNNFRQNVQDGGIFDAPDATVSLDVQCTMPVTAQVSLRNAGLASLPANVQIGVFTLSGAVETQVGLTWTTQVLFPGQTQILDVAIDPAATPQDTFFARVLLDPVAPTFHECKEDNNESEHVVPVCVQ